MKGEILSIFDPLETWQCSSEDTNYSDQKLKSLNLLWCSRFRNALQIQCRACVICRSIAENSLCVLKRNGMNCSLQFAAVSNTCCTFASDLLHLHDTQASMVCARYSKHENTCYIPAFYPWNLLREPAQSQLNFQHNICTLIVILWS